MRAPQHALDLGALGVGLVSQLHLELEHLARLRLERFDDPEDHENERGGESRHRIESDPRRQADSQRGEHDAGVLRILDLGAVANEPGRADHAERAREVGADHHHHHGADDRKDDLRLDDGRLTRWRAAAARAQRQACPEQRGHRQPDERRRDLGERIGWRRLVAPGLKGCRVLRAQRGRTPRSA